MGWSGGQVNHSPVNSTAAALGLAQAPELVRPALPGSLRRKRRRRRRVEMQSLEEEPESLEQGGAKQARREGNGVRSCVQVCDIEGWASERAWAAFSGQR